MLLPSIQGADILQDLMRGVRLVKAAKTSVPGVQTYTLLQTEVPERKLEGGGGIETVGSEFVPGGDRPINRHVESEPCEENEVDELAAKTLGTRHPPEVFPVPADGKKEGFRQKLRLAALVEGDCSALRFVSLKFLLHLHPDKDVRAGDGLGFLTGRMREYRECVDGPRPWSHLDWPTVTFPGPQPRGAESRGSWGEPALFSETRAGVRSPADRVAVWQ
ncbi:unnamed protein product [Rangifer tarandus platyrhynchus]|uniref:Uncharacterized protein n=1 Tax=Rangifer tarandus platyrhynchus TaxID=3082113 RepID=A0ABN8ZIZ3_RANTA|nr:unnamed protein product [Rangifer tarandus platyrhynchus]